MPCHGLIVCWRSDVTCRRCARAGQAPDDAPTRPGPHAPMLNHLLAVIQLEGKWRRSIFRQRLWQGGAHEDDHHGVGVRERRGHIFRARTSVSVRNAAGKSSGLRQCASAPPTSAQAQLRLDVFLLI
jgi:hypothetical protein